MYVYMGIGDWGIANYTTFLDLKLKGSVKFVCVMTGSGLQQSQLHGLLGGTIGNYFAGR